MAQKIGRPCAKLVVPSIGSNTQHGPGGAAGAAAQLLGEHLVIGKALGDQRAEHALDGEVDLGDEIDRALLVDLEIAAEARHLQLAGADDRLDGRGRDTGDREPLRHWPDRRRRRAGRA